MKYLGETPTLLLEGEVFRQMPAFVIAPQQVQSRRVTDLQCP